MVKVGLTFVAVLLLLSCSSAPVIIEKPYPVFIPGVHDTIELVQDTVYLPSDSLAYWEGNVEDSLNNIIGWLKVYYNKRIAELKLHAKADTVYIPIENSKYVALTQFLERMIATFFATMPFYWQILLIVLMLAMLFIIYKLWIVK